MDIWRFEKVRMKRNLAIKRYNGDDEYSWAIFEAKDVKGITGVVLYGDAKPIFSGLSKQEAKYHKSELEK